MNALRRTWLLLSLMLGWVLAGWMSASGQTVRITSVHDFLNIEGVYPHNLILGSDGNFYTTTTHLLTPKHDLWKVAPDGTATDLYTFSGPDGNYPTCLVMGTDGSLYGTTAGGGANNTGTVYKLAAPGILAWLYSFSSLDTSQTNTDGANPWGLFQGQDGNFYGFTTQGGPHSGGTVFQITSAGILTTLHAFLSSSTDPDGPQSLIQGANGNLYGTTQAGSSGSNSTGTVFKMTLTGTLTLLHSFNGTDGYSPLGLMFGADGNLYGVTSESIDHPGVYGSIFKITPDGTFTTLHVFQGNDGSSPDCAMTQGLDGNLYGSTYFGGAYGEGTLFQLTPAGTLTTLYNFFGNVDGGNPNSTLIQANDGSFYGGGSNGGADRAGNIYHLVTGLPYVPGDFNQDSYPDILLQNVSTGELALWYLTNGYPNVLASVTPIQDPYWKAIAVTALQGDQHPDVLFYNPSTGRMAFWFMDNNQATDGVFVSPTQDLDWKPVGMADFNGDGHPDILFTQPNTGQLALWYMNRNYLVSATYVYPVQDPNWQVVGIGDFNGDGHPDILFQNASTGQLVVWYMGETNYAIDGVYVKPIPDAGWQAVAVEDFDGDGHPDILLQNTSTGQLAIWYMNDNQRISQTILSQVPAPQWKVVGPR